MLTAYLLVSGMIFVTRAMVALGDLIETKNWPRGRKPLEPVWDAVTLVACALLFVWSVTVASAVHK